MAISLFIDTFRSCKLYPTGVGGMAVSRKTLNIQIGARIKKARIKAGFNQAMFAERLGLSTQHISCIETGTAGTSLETLKKICELLHVSSDLLLMGGEQGAKRGLEAKIQSVPEPHAEYVSAIIDQYLYGISLEQQKKSAEKDERHPSDALMK